MVPKSPENSGSTPTPCSEKNVIAQGGGVINVNRQAIQALGGGGLEGMAVLNPLHTAKHLICGQLQWPSELNGTPHKNTLHKSAGLGRQRGGGGLAVTEGLNQLRKNVKTDGVRNPPSPSGNNTCGQVAQIVLWVAHSPCGPLSVWRSP